MTLSRVYPANIRLCFHRTPTLDSQQLLEFQGLKKADSFVKGTDMWIALVGLFTIFRRLWSEPAFRALILVEALLLAVGMRFYHSVEGWSWLDSAYFCVVTMASVGYGDLHPVTPLGRLFAIFYIILGVAMLGVFIQLAGKTAYESLQESVQSLQEKKMNVKQ